MTKAAYISTRLDSQSAKNDGRAALRALFSAFHRRPAFVHRAQKFLSTSDRKFAPQPIQVRTGYSFRGTGQRLLAITLPDPVRRCTHYQLTKFMRVVPVRGLNAVAGPHPRELNDATDI